MKQFTSAELIDIMIMFVIVIWSTYWLTYWFTSNSSDGYTDPIM